jgi:hypothetical protein
MILRHFQFGFAGVMECSLVAAVDDRTYVFGVTSTAFVWSEARRKMTHELGRMPLLDAMAGRVYLSFSVDAVHCRLSKSCQSLCKSILRQRQLRRQDNREVLSSKASHVSLSLLQLRRTEPYAAPITQKIIVALWGYD